MKSMIVLCILALVTIAHQSSIPSKVNYDDPYNLRIHCEVGTHVYFTDCIPFTPEATCEEPNPKQEEDFVICDFAACYCDPPTVRDTESGKCVKIDKCPKK